MQDQADFHLDVGGGLGGTTGAIGAVEEAEVFDSFTLRRGEEGDGDVVGRLFAEDCSRIEVEAEVGKEGDAEREASASCPFWSLGDM